MSHPKLPYRRATNVRLSVYHCSMIRFPAAYCRGAAPGDTIDRWPWQIIAYNVEGIQKFQSSVAAWFRLKIYICWASGKEKVKHSSGVQIVLKDTHSVRSTFHQIAIRQENTHKIKELGCKLHLMGSFISKSSILNLTFCCVNVSYSAARCSSVRTSFMCCIPEKIKKKTKIKCQQALVWHIISPSGLPDTCPLGAWGVVCVCVCVRMGRGGGWGVCLGVLL